MRRAILALLTMMLIGTALPAAADPIGDKRNEAERIARELEAQGRRVSVLAEEFNLARLEAERVEARVGAAAVEVAETKAKAKAAKGRLRDQAVEAYVNGGSAPALSLLVESSTVDDLAVRNHYVRSITANTADAIDELHAVRASLEHEQAGLDEARAKARAALEDVDGRRRAAAAAEAEQRKLLLKVRGELSSLVAAEARRRAEAAERAARAELAARLEREAASRRAAAARTTTTTTLARTTTTTAKPAAGSPAPAPTGSAGATHPGAEAAVAEARRQLGKPYQYGGSGPDSFDCSGLTAWAWKAGGVTLPHSSRAQRSATRRIAIGDLLPGDIVFYGDPIHHVGLYIGDGQMIEASETGTPVRQTTIFRKDLVGAGRVG